MKSDPHEAPNGFEADMPIQLPNATDNDQVIQSARDGLLEYLNNELDKDVLNDYIQSFMKNDLSGDVEVDLHMSDTAGAVDDLIEHILDSFDK